jgi:hypothetical protein
VLIEEEDVIDIGNRPLNGDGTPKFYHFSFGGNEIIFVAQ